MSARFTRSPWLYGKDSAEQGGYFIHNGTVVIARGLSLRDAKLVAVSPSMYQLLKRSHGLLRLAAEAYDFEPAEILTAQIEPVLAKATGK